MPFSHPKTSNENPKIALGTAAAELIEEGMVVGLGTGSTATCFIASLIKRCQQGLKITAVATSEQSQRQAAAGGIHVVDLNDVISIDLTVDGADEIDRQKRMIKGGGGALLREKIVAKASREMVVIVDHSKLVDKLGKFPLPVEVIVFGYKATLHHIEKLGYAGSLRMKADSKTPFVADEGHYIFDLQFAQPVDHPEQIEAEILNIPGVVDTGFFFNLAGRVMVSLADGRIEVR